MRLLPFASRRTPGCRTHRTRPRARRRTACTEWACLVYAAPCRIRPLLLGTPAGLCARSTARHPRRARWADAGSRHSATPRHCDHRATAIPSTTKPRVGRDPLSAVPGAADRLTHWFDVDFSMSQMRHLGVRAIDVRSRRWETYYANCYPKSAHLERRGGPQPTTLVRAESG